MKKRNLRRRASNGEKLLAIWRVERRRSPERADAVVASLRAHESSNPFSGAPVTPRLEDFELLFEDFFKPLGGKRGATYHETTDETPNADFVLPSDKLIFELKSLEAAINFSAQGAERLKQVFEKIGVPFEEMLPFLMGKGPIPPDVGAEIFRIVRQNLRSDIRKAYRQLNSTWSAIGDEEYRRVLILVNSGVTILPDPNLRAMAAGLMREGGYWDKGIEAVIIYSGNTYIQLETSGRTYSMWSVFFKDDDKNRAFGGVLDRLGTQFLKFLSARVGEPDQEPMLMESPEDFFLLATMGSLVRPSS